MLRQPGLYLDFKSVLKLKLRHKKKIKAEFKGFKGNTVTNQYLQGDSKY